MCPYGSTAAVKGAAVSTQGRLLRATIDRRFLCRPISFDTGSAAAVGRQGRWTQHLFAWLAEGGEESEELRQQRLRASSARGGLEKALHRGLCGAARRGSDLRAGETVLERAGVAGEVRPRRFSRPGYSTGLFEQQVPVKSVLAQMR